MIVAKAKSVTMTIKGLIISHHLQQSKLLVGRLSYALPSTNLWELANTLRTAMIGIGISVLIGALIVVYFVARTMVKPVQTAVNALKILRRGRRFNSSATGDW